MEVDDELRVLAARSATGSVRLVRARLRRARAPPFGDDLILLTTGTALVVQGAPQEVHPSTEWSTGRTWAGIWAKVDIDLYAGDDVIRSHRQRDRRRRQHPHLRRPGPGGHLGRPRRRHEMTFAGPGRRQLLPVLRHLRSGRPRRRPDRAHRDLRQRRRRHLQLHVNVPRREDPRVRLRVAHHAGGRRQRRHVQSCSSCRTWPSPSATRSRSTASSRATPTASRPPAARA